MGCNTSKESVQPVEGEEKTEKTEDTVEGVTATPTPDEKEKEEKPEEKDNSKDALSNPASGNSIKALTPTDSSSVRGERLSNHLAATTPEPPPLDDEIETIPADLGGEEEEQAATKIQAVFRGHQTRRTMKQAQQPQDEPTKEQLEQEFRADDLELCKAATTIQNSFRSHMKQKTDGKEGEASSANKEENKEEEELDIDLTDPDLHKAATKIQASFRGHKVRKETDNGDTEH